MTLSTLTYRRSSLPGKAYLAALALAGMVFYMFNVLTTLKGDDMLYSYIIGTDYVPIRSLAGWLKSLPGLYVQENGRMANILTQLFAGVLGKPLFDVLNALMLVLLLHLVVVHVAGKARPVVVVAITMLMIFAVIPYPGETLLWMCGSLNYLWATTFTLYWLHWLHSRRSSRLMAWQQVALFLASWVAGQMNEAVTVPVALGLCMWLVATRKRPDAVLLTAMAGYCLGVLLIVCSPGAWARVRSGDVNLAGSAAWLLGRRLLVVGYKAVIYVFPATAVLLMTWEGKHHGWRKLAAGLWPWIMLGCVLLLYALGDSKKPRLYFFFTLVGYIYTMRWLYCRYGSRARLRRAAAVLCALACIYPVAAVAAELRAYKAYNSAMVARIAAAPANCVLPASSYRNTVWSRRWIAPNYYDSMLYSGYNDLYERYYGKHHVAFVREPLMQRYLSANFVAGTQLVPMRSSHSRLVDTVLAVPGSSYSIIPIDSAHLDKHNCGLDFDLDPVHNRNTETPAVYYYDNKIRTHNHLPFFNIFHRGRCYLIVPAVERDVVHLRIPVVSGGKEVWVDLYR